MKINLFSIHFNIYSNSHGKTIPNNNELIMMMMMMMMMNFEILGIQQDKSERSNKRFAKKDPQESDKNRQSNIIEEEIIPSTSQDSEMRNNVVPSVAENNTSGDHVDLDYETEVEIDEVLNREESEESQEEEAVPEARPLKIKPRRANGKKKYYLLFTV